MRFVSKSKMEDIAGDAGFEVALNWDGDCIEGAVEILRIANHWSDREVEAFRAGFYDGRNDFDELPSESETSDE